MPPAVSATASGNGGCVGRPPPAAYDLFISCNEADAPWVHDELLGPLQNAGLLILAEWDFLGGEDVVAARERAVETSRHTLIVLSEEWCSSYTAESDALLARYLDPNSCARKLLPLVLRECPLPPGVARLVNRLVKYDFSKAYLRQASLAKLLKDLGRSPQANAEAVAQSARKGISALVVLMRTDAARAAASGASAALAGARDDIDFLNRCKKMHEYLHSAEEELKEFLALKDELLCRLQERQERADGEKRCDDQWLRLEAFFHGQLKPKLIRLAQYARRAGFPPDHVLWVPAVEQAQAALDKVWLDRDVKGLGRATAGLARILGEEPNKFNTRLFNTAEHLRLGQVVTDLRGIRQTVGDDEFDTGATERLRDFQKGLTALEELNGQLQSLVANHNCLQYIDFSLRPLADPAVTAEEIGPVWDALQGTMDQLRTDSGADWALGFLKTREELGRALAEADRDERAARKAKSSFFNFCGHVSVGFTHVDLDLFNLCERLQQIGEELNGAIGRMQHGD